MTGTAHEVWGVIKVWMGGLKFPSTSPNELRVTLYDP